MRVTGSSISMTTASSSLSIEAVCASLILADPISPVAENFTPVTKMVRLNIFIYCNMKCLVWKYLRK